jgi:predicted peptidase
MKSALTGLYWFFSLALVVGAVFLLLARPDLFKHVDTAKGMPPMPPVPTPTPAEMQAQQDVRARISYEMPRTQNPLGDLTKFYKQKELLVGHAPRERTLTYHLYTPAKPYPEGLKFPLVLVLHDVFGHADAGEYLIEGDMPVKHPAFIAVPVLPYAKVWSMPQEFPEMENFARPYQGQEALPDAIQLVEAMRKQYPIDDKRIYVIGCSEGGFGAFGAALHYPDIFAAAVPVASGWTAEDARGFAKVPLWVFHGAVDMTFPAGLSHGAASYISAYGGKANYTEVPNMGHDCSSAQFYLPAMWDWLFQQHK